MSNSISQSTSQSTIQPDGQATNPAPSQLVLCNCPDEAIARQIARLLVDQRLAACVNWLPGVRSVYRWQQNIEEATEVTLLIKTSQARYAAVEQAIQQAHPFAVPEILAVDISNGLPAYLQWLQNSL